MTAPLAPAAVRLLLVEDDEGVAEMYGMQLARSGFTVVTARSGEEGLRLARAESPHLIFLDLGLPEMSGLEMLEQLRARPDTADIAVVVLTNLSEPELIERSRALGVKDYLIKAHTTPARLSESTWRWLRADPATS